MASSPYVDVPGRGFWRSGVAAQNPLDIDDIYRRKFRISRKDAIAAAGSCFAQHISRHLRARKFNVLQHEPAPRGMTPLLAAKYGFGVYSCRYGNIYTVAQMLQLAREAFGISTPADPVWQRDGRFFDAQRPNVEPHGFDSADHVLAVRARHLQHVRRMLLDMDVFVFTLGLTECWRHIESGTVYPTAPGTIAGSYDDAVHEFHNCTHSEVLDDFVKLKRLLNRERGRRRLRFILTVSPVPLTATASGEHVLAASTYSKAVLRGVAGELAQANPNVDYFPSFELITAPVTRGMHFAANQREVTAAGVETAMRAFLAQHDPRGADRVSAAQEPAANPETDDTDAAVDQVVCEDVLLEAFQS